MAALITALAPIGFSIAQGVAAAAPALSAAGSIASGAASIGTSIAGGIQAGKQPPDPDKKRRALAERMLQEGAGRRAIGQQATLLTGASGLTNPANVGKKTLLGG